jgi:predicted nucleotidyltransferase
MGINQIKKPLNQFLREVSKSIKVDQMIIFGSYAKGTATPDSDIDVLVISDNFKKVREDKRLNILDRAARFIRPEIVAAGFTNEELVKFGELSILGQARMLGARFV